MNSPLMNKLFIFILLSFGAFFLLRLSFVLMALIMPFILGFLIAAIANPVKKRIEKFGVPRSLSAFFAIVLMLGVVFLFFYLLFFIAKSGFISVEKYISLMADSFTGSVRNVYRTLQIQYPRLITKDFNTFMSDLQGGGLLSLNEFNFGGKIFSFAKSLPSTLVFIIFTLMSSYYLSTSFDEIIGFIRKRILTFDWAQNLVGDFKASIRLGLVSWLKAQLVIMSISFIISTIFFTFLKIPYAIFMGMGLALFDALPLFGAGAVLWPISIYFILTENYVRGLFSLLLYVLIIAMRQVIEPKLIGQQIGIHPLLTLLTIYLGYKLLGVAGIIVGVIILIIATSIINGKAFTNLYKASEEEHE